MFGFFLIQHQVKQFSGIISLHQIDNATVEVVIKLQCVNKVQVIPSIVTNAEFTNHIWYSCGKFINILRENKKTSRYLSTADAYTSSQVNQFTFTPDNQSLSL